MADATTETKPNLVPTSNQGVPNSGAPTTTIKRTAKKPFDGDFYKWPNCTEDPLPDFIIEKVISHRPKTPIATNNPSANFWKGFAKREKGYSYVGKSYNADQLLTDNEKFAIDKEFSAPGEVDSVKQASRKKAYLDVIERMEAHEVKGEGTTDSVMTGDGALFTWGRGLGYNKGAMASAFSAFLNSSEEIKNAFIEHGIAMVDEQLYIVDTDNRTILVHTDAANYINGAEPSELKRRLLTSFVELTNRFGPQAATAQWRVILKKFIEPNKKHILAAIDAGWSTPMITYVVHCNMWGKFAGWEPFLKTGGDPKTVLRLEVDYTNFYTFTKTRDGRGSYLFVPITTSGGVAPAGTMINNMGDNEMHKFLTKWETKEEYESKVQDGDVVFQVLGKGTGSNKHFYYILSGTHQIIDANEKYNIWVEEHHGLPMTYLLTAVRDLSNKNGLKKTLDYYQSPNNPKRLFQGKRPVIAMQAEMARNDFFKAVEVMQMCKDNGITLSGTPDQYHTLLKHMNLEPLDTWVDQNYDLPTETLIAKIKSKPYKETKSIRDWYASDANQGKERFGLWPRIALDAVLHKGEGNSAAWLLNDFAAAKITEQENPKDFAIIKQTLGLT